MALSHVVVCWVEADKKAGYMRVDVSRTLARRRWELVE